MLVSADTGGVTEDLKLYIETKRRKENENAETTADVRSVHQKAL